MASIRPRLIPVVHGLDTITAGQFKRVVIRFPVVAIVEHQLQPAESVYCRPGGFDPQEVKDPPPVAEMVTPDVVVETEIPVPALMLVVERAVMKSGVPLKGLKTVLVCSARRRELINKKAINRKNLICTCTLFVRPKSR